MNYFVGAGIETLPIHAKCINSDMQPGKVMRHFRRLLYSKGAVIQYPFWKNEDPPSACFVLFGTGVSPLTSELGFKI